MTCHCDEPTEARATSDELGALWALACAATERQAGLIPSDLRPMNADDALNLLTPRPNEVAGPYSMAVLGVADVASGLTRRGGVARMSPGAEAVEKRSPDALSSSLSESFGVTNASARAFVDALVAPSLHPKRLCGKATSTSNYQAPYTAVHSEFVVFSPIEKLARKFDPRAWGACRGLFQEAYAVGDLDGDCIPRIDTPDSDLGKTWCGRIYERARVGPQEVEHVLKIDYRVGETICLDYELASSISQRLGGLELQGLLRDNSGWLRAKTAWYDPDDVRPENALNRAETRPVCTEPYTCRGTKVESIKNITYRRLSSWSAGAMLDYGEICNYLAPSFLTLWVANLQLVVPCCTGAEPSPAE